LRTPRTGNAQCADVEDAARNLIANHYDVSRESIQLDVQLEASEDHCQADPQRAQAHVLQSSTSAATGCHIHTFESYPHRGYWSGIEDHGYRPSLGYLRELGALEPDGTPIHVRGISCTHAGLVYLGLEHQRSFASNTLRGVSDDARAVIAPLAAWIRDAPARVGLISRDHAPLALTGV